MACLDSITVLVFEHILVQLIAQSRAIMATTPAYCN